MKPQTSLTGDIKGTTAKIYTDFKRIREAISDTVVPAPAAAAGYTQAEAQKLVDDEKMRIVDAFAYAFMINLLPAELRTKVLEQKPETIGDTFTVISESHKRILDEKRPLTITPSMALGPRVNAVEPEGDQVEALMSLVQKRFNLQRSNSGNNQNNQNSNKKKKKGGQGGQSGQVKKCTYCNKNGHGTIDCFKRKDDKAPCYNARGEPFYPEGESAKVSTSPNLESPKKKEASKPEETTETVPQKGSGFPGRV